MSTEPDRLGAEWHPAETLSQRAYGAVDAAGDMADDAVRVARKTVDGIVEHASDQPLLTLFAGVVGGYLLGFLIHGRRR